VVGEEHHRLPRVRIRHLHPAAGYGHFAAALTPVSSMSLSRTIPRFSGTARIPRSV
jgi:hypothetical protein